MSEDGDDEIPLYEWDVFARSELLWRGLSDSKGPMPAFVVRSWNCSECKAWADACKQWSISLMGRVAPDADTAPLGANGLCHSCHPLEDRAAYWRERGADDEARNPANYTPAFLVKSYAVEHGRIKPIGQA